MGQIEVKIEFFLDPAVKGFNNWVSAVNPKLIKDYGNNTLRKVKTDKADVRGQRI